MQLIGTIAKRYKKIGRIEEGNDLLRYLRTVFFPTRQDEEDNNKN
jgi:hypothetical protein